MFGLYLTIFEIFVNQLKCQTFDLANEGHGQGAEPKNGTCAIRLKICDSILVISFRILSALQHIFKQTVT